MDISAVLTADCGPATLYRWVHDLADYPRWLDLVHRAVPDEAADPGDGDTDGRSGLGDVSAPTEDQPVWSVELRARVGPLARSKRLRMRRTQAVKNELVRFERYEVDGRSHSSWVLQAQIVDRGTARADGGTADGGSGEGPSTLTMTLHYGGGLWSGAVLERVLNDQINTGRDRLKELVESPAGMAPRG